MIRETHKRETRPCCPKGKSHPKYYVVNLAAATMSDLQICFFEEAVAGEDIRSKFLADVKIGAKMAASAYNHSECLSDFEGIIGVLLQMFSTRGEMFVRQRTAANQDCTRATGCSEP